MDVIATKMLTRLGLDAVRALEEAGQDGENLGISDVLRAGRIGTLGVPSMKNLFLTESFLPYEEVLNCVENTSLNPTLYDVPNLGEVNVTGDPFELAKVLDDCQGDNMFNFHGDCGLVSVSNILTIAGINADEDDVVERAIKMGLCEYSKTFDPSNNGGTFASQRIKLLESYGIKCTLADNKDGLGSMENLAKFVEQGHGVNISVNAGNAWNMPEYVYDGSSNHSIIVTGTVRDKVSGELKGFYVCDSGLTDTESGARFLSVEQLKKCYINAKGSSAVITNDAIR